jgi:hypothetical protein
VASRASTQQPPPPQPVQSNAAKAALVAVILGSALMPSFALPALIPILVVDRAKAGIAALRVALRILDTFPAPVMQGVGAAQAEMIRENELRRSAYVVNAYLRLRRAIEDARASGIGLEQAEEQTLSAERRYFVQHITAAAQRMAAASKVDSLSIQYGPVLGWYAQNDSRTTAECRAADGKNFSALIPPVIGWPGVVHVHCRCQPGKPHKGAALLPMKGTA